MIKAESFFSLSLNTSSNHQQQQQEQHEMVEVEEMERKGRHIILPTSSSPLLSSIFVHLICRTLTTCKNKNNMRC